MYNVILPFILKIAMNSKVLLSFLLSFVPSIIAQFQNCNNICPINEIFSPNTSQCQPTCYSRNFEKVLFKCDSGKGCECKDGYVRDQDTYKCIPMSSCKGKPTNNTCPLNEIYSDCLAGCPQTCKTRYRDYKCKCVPGCVCKRGFVRSDINFQCIPIKLCES